MSEPANKQEIETDAQWAPLQCLQCELTVDLSVPHFTIGDLLRLGENEILNTECPQGADISVRVNGTLIGWSEFEVVEDHLAIRITQLA